MGSYLIKDCIGSYGFFFFTFIFRISFLILFRCNDWFIIWLRLEINIFSFLLMIRKKFSNRIESCVKYFFIQSLGSSLLIIRFYRQIDFVNEVTSLILGYKIGAGPFFFWFPAICSNISWGSCFLLIRIQKIIPILLISFYIRRIVWFIVIRRILIGALGIINQTNIKRLIAYSSIHHIGWLLVCVYINIYIWVIYLIIYRFIILGVIFIFSKNENFYINILLKVNEKWILVLGLFSIGGLPPILGFFLKWWTFYNIVWLNYYIIRIIIILSVIIFYYYVRIVYVILFGERLTFVWMCKKLVMEKINSYDSLFLIGTLVAPSIGFVLMIYCNKINILLIFKVKSANLIWIYSSSSLIS